MTNRQVESVEDTFERALGGILARVSTSARRIAIAYSGGLDSSVLLHLASSYSRDHGLELFAFHIHHGFSKNADNWLAHCERECAALGIRLDARRIQVQAIERDGVEQAARTSRYAALGELCRLHSVSLLLTAHHQDDQAETVLLQMLRGAGLPGLSGMAPTNEAYMLLGGSSPQMVRPLLELTRDELEQYVARYRIGHIEDESNDDLQFSRNALRHKVMSALDAYFPGYQRRIARVANHVQSAQRLLTELASQDLQACAEGDCIDIARLRLLSDDRQDNLLRYWFSQQRVRMPSTSWLMEMRAQLLDAREDAQVRVIHPDCEVRRHRGRAYLIPRECDASPDVSPIVFRWQGESRILFSEFGGALHFEASEEGVSADWLAQQTLEIRRREGGEKLKLAPGRPTRSLKHHYQALGIPVWQRRHLPVVLASGRLIFAAGIGMNSTEQPHECGKSICLRWENGII